MANENIPSSSIKYLTAKGYDVKAIGKDFSGIKDHEVIQISIAEDRTILTHDSDYGELIFKYGNKPPAGVIFIWVQPTFPEQTGEIVYNLLKKTNFLFARL